MNNALVTDEQRIVLLASGRESLDNPHFDPAPVVELFTPDAGATWLLTEIDSDDHAFGLCDLGLGTPEIGWVSLDELATVRMPTGTRLGVVRRDQRQQRRPRHNPVHLGQESERSPSPREGGHAKSRFTTEQIIGFIKQADAGMAVLELARHHSFSPASF